MSTKKVFIGSTGLDLKEYRQAAIEVCNELKLVPIAMEFFEAMGKGATGASKDKLNAADVYVGIFAHRYGYIEEGYNKSVTELEFDHAGKRSLNRLCFLVDPKYPWPPEAWDPEHHRQLEQFKQRIDKLVRSQFTTVDNFKEQLLRALLPYKKGTASPNWDAPHQIPDPPDDFTGRTEELKQLSAIINAGTRIIGLHGMGGSGKTALAWKLAKEHVGLYPDGQIYLNLRGTDQRPISLKDAMLHVIHAWHPEIILPHDESELLGRYRSVLHGKRALLLMDNAAGKAQVEPLIPTAGSLLLITARNHFVLPGGHALRLKALAVEDALQLLTKIAPQLNVVRPEDKSIGPESVAQTIARICGYLPHALRVAAITLTEHIDLTPEAYLQRLRNAKKRLTLIDSVLKTSYDLLPKELQARWRVLSVFPDHFMLIAASTIWHTPLESTEDSLSELVRLGLVDWMGAAGPSGHAYYRLHDLARVFAAAKTSAKEMFQARRMSAGLMIVLLYRVQSMFRSGSKERLRGMRLLHPERPNIRAAVLWAIENSEASKDAARACLKLILLVCRLSELQLSPAEKIQWLESSLPVAQRLRDRNAQAHLLGNMAIEYRHLGQPQKTVELIEKSRSVGSRKRPLHDQCIDFFTLGNAYYDLDDQQRAIGRFEQALDLYRKTDDRHGEASVLSNLAIACAQSGQYKRGLAYHNRAIELFDKLDDKSEQARVLANLGNVLVRQGEATEAIKLLKQSRAIAQDLGDRREEARSLLNLAIAFAALADYSQAEESFATALTLYRETAEQLKEAQTLYFLGAFHEERGQFQQATDFFQMSLDVARAEGYAKEEAIALLGMGIAKTKSGDAKGGRTALEQALALHRAVGNRRGEFMVIDRMIEACSQLGDKKSVAELKRQRARLNRDTHKKGETLNLSPRVGNSGVVRAAKANLKANQQKWNKEKPA